MKGFGKCVAVRICPRIYFCGESISKNAFRRFESGYGSKNPEMHLQNFEKLQSQKIAPIRFDGLGQEKSLEISRFLAVWLAKRLFPSSRSKLTCHHVSTGHFRCQICVIQFRCTRRIDFSRGKSGLAKPCV